LTLAWKIGVYKQTMMTSGHLPLITHFGLSVLLYFAAPAEYLTHPVAAMSYRTHQPEGSAVTLIYVLCSLYHNTMLFWDPSISRDKGWHHYVLPWLLPVLIVVRPSLTLVYTALVVSIAVEAWEARRPHEMPVSLFLMMRVHHVLTLLLLTLSWMHGYASVGVFVLFLHDITDVFMYTLRAFRNSPDAPFAVVIAMAVTVVGSWTYFRVWRLGGIVMDLVAVENTPWALVCCTCMLSVLFAFNLYWTGLVVTKLVRAVMTKH
jgi:hypothetical protein